PRHDPGGREPRPAPRTGRHLRDAAVGLRAARSCGAGGRGPDARPSLRLERQAAARSPRSGRSAFRHLASRATAGTANMNLQIAQVAPAAVEDRLWYKDAVIYQLHLKSFFDSNNDGIGDFPGLLSKLDYIADLGATAIWLLPFYPSPLLDDGYDIGE